MHVAIAWDSKPLLLLTTALLPNRTTESFQMEAGPPYDKQRIQMGLRSGNTVLIYFRSGVDHYQCVLIALVSDLNTNKPWQGQHKFWKCVSPIRTNFAWLPEQLARTYCGAALERRSGLPYGGVHHLQGQESDKKGLFATSSQEPSSGLGKDDCMGCHAGTGGDSSGDNGVLGFRDPVTGTEHFRHVISIVQDS